MKAAIVRTKVFTNATASGLSDDINAFLAALGEQAFLDLQFQFDGATYTAFLVYTE